MRWLLRKIVDGLIWLLVAILGPIFKLLPQPHEDEEYRSILRAVSSGNQAEVDRILQIRPKLLNDMGMGGNLLHSAAYSDHPEMLEFLISKGADVNAAEVRDKITPLHLAAEKGKLTNAKILVEHGANVNAISCGSTPLGLAVREGHRDVVHYLAEYGTHYNPLHLVAFFGDTSKVAELLASGADINDKDGAGYTPLHWAVWGGEAAREMVGFLLSQGAAVQGNVDEAGWTPLYVAALTGNLEAAKTLLSYGADVNTATKIGYTPLLVAESRGYSEMARLFLESGADPQARSGFGETPLHKAVSEDDAELLDELLKRGADPNAKTSLIKAPGPGGITGWQFTPRNAYTPLHIAAMEGNARAAEVLIRHGVDVNVLDAEDRTPLHDAVLESHPEVAALLVSVKADLHIKDKKGKTALDLALESGNDEIAALIRNSG